MTSFRVSPVMIWSSTRSCRFCGRANNTNRIVSSGSAAAVKVSTAIPLAIDYNLALLLYRPPVIFAAQPPQAAPRRHHHRHQVVYMQSSVIAQHTTVGFLSMTPWLGAQRFDCAWHSLKPKQIKSRPQTDNIPLIAFRRPKTIYHHIATQTDETQSLGAE
jgi:hypothetical protein